MAEPCTPIVFATLQAWRRFPGSLAEDRTVSFSMDNRSGPSNVASQIWDTATVRVAYISLRPQAREERIPARLQRTSETRVFFFLAPTSSADEQASGIALLREDLRVPVSV